MNVCIVCGGYPTKNNPEYAFIRPVVATLSDVGITCTVISPQNVMGQFKRKRSSRPITWVDYSDKGNAVTILQPKALSMSSLKINGETVSNYFRNRAIRKALYNMETSPNILYGHFWDAAISAAIASEGKIPVVAVSGESTIRVRDRYNAKTIEKYLPCIKGVICVSSKNLEESRDLGLLKYNPKITVLPNGFDSKDFHPMERLEVRKELGIGEKEIVGSFVGAFTERKGVNRVIEAAKKVPSMKLLLIGGGGQVEESNQILFKGSLPHSDICKYLNASDFFVLPTLAEGCCNAIVEALACGLPVISSDMQFNKDILNEKNAILINPNNIDQIAEAMEYLCQDVDRRTAMQQNAKEMAECLKIENRCLAISSFLKRIVQSE